MSVNEESFEALCNELRGIIIDGTEVSRDESGYAAAAEAMCRAAVAAFNYVARDIDATGFQASWAALKAYAQIMRIDGPLMVIEGENAVYPQYDIPGRVAEWLGSEEMRAWLRDRAKQRLADSADHAAPAVIAHWRKLAASAKGTQDASSTGRTWDEYPERAS